MRKKILVLLLAYFSMYSQSNGQSLFDKGDVTIRTSPFSLAEADGGIMIGAAYHFSEKFSFTLDPSVIFFNPYQSGYSQTSQPLGIKVRSDVRYHFPGRVLQFGHCFVAVEVHFKHTRTLKEETFGINCIQDQCDYYMIDNYKELKTEFGAAFKSGFELSLSRNDKWSLELYGGLGAKHLSFHDKGVPAGGEFKDGVNHDILPWEREDRFYPFMPLGLKVVYRL